MIAKLKNRVLGVVFLSMFISCTQNPNSKNKADLSDSLKNNPSVTAAKDTLTFSYKKVTSKSVLIDKKQKSDTAIAEISYPIFTKANGLNDSIKLLTNANISPDEPVMNNPQKTIDQFIKKYEIDRKKYPEVFPYKLNITIEVLSQTDESISLKSKYYNYTGGAHSNYGTLFKNYFQNAKPVLLKDIVRSEIEFQKIAEKIFRKQENLSEQEALKGYFFKDDQFALNNNFTISKKGLLFIYNPYEIKAFSKGQTELFIPYAAFKSIIKPNTFLTKYIQE